MIAKRLVEAALGLLRRHREPGELVVAIALADPEIEPAAGQEVERRGLFGEQHRIVPRQHDDRRAKPQCRRARGDPGQQVQGRRDLADLREMVLGDEAAVKPERLRLDMVVDKIVIAARAFRRLHAASRRRAAEQPEPHRFAPFRSVPLPRNYRQAQVYARAARADAAQLGGSARRLARPATTASNICGVSVPVFVFSREQ